MRASIQPAKDRLGFVELVLNEPGDGGAGAGLALQALDFQDLPLGFGLGPRGEVFANALSVQPAGNAINDLPGGIREF